MNKLEKLEEINNGKVILMFSAVWCGDCVVIDLYIDNVIEKFPQYQFYKVDSDDFPELVNKYDIMGIPSFVALDNNEVIGTLISKLQKTQPEIENWITSL